MVYTDTQSPSWLSDLGFGANSLCVPMTFVLHMATKYISSDASNSDGTKEDMKGSLKGSLLTSEGKKKITGRGSWWLQLSCDTLR